MTLVDTPTGETVTYGDVRRSIDSAKASLEQAAEQIVWQIENQAWRLLGYSDWNEMREAEYGGAAFMVPRAERPELVARMRRSGLTQQEIADTAGVSRPTVVNDLASMSDSDIEEPPEPITNARGQQRPASYRPRPEPAPSVEQAVAEFPDLAYYVQTGRSGDVLNMAGDLRRFRDRGDLDDRLDNLRRSIAVDRAKRDGTYRDGTTATPDGNGGYHMTPLPTPPEPTTRTCPTCSGRGVIEEKS